MSGGSAPSKRKKTHKKTLKFAIARETSCEFVFIQHTGGGSKWVSWYFYILYDIRRLPRGAAYRYGCRRRRSAMSVCLCDVLRIICIFLGFLCARYKSATDLRKVGD